MSYLEMTFLPSGIAPRKTRTYRLAALLLVAYAGAVTALADNPATTVSVDANANRRPINPNIYGQNWANPSEISALNAPVDRYGGNANSRYNWQIDAHSSGADWYFETYSDGDGTGTPGGSVDKSIVDTRSAGNGVEPMITIPMLDYLAKLGPNRSTLAGFSVKKYGAQQKVDPWNSDAGNGVSTATGKNITGNDPLDTGVANSPEIQKAWVQHLVSKFGNATASTGVKYYILDNEPSIWSGTHRDVHPNRPGYDEMYNKVVAYASAIRSADPSAQIIGPEEWDWWAMYVSGIDQGGGNDYASHGNVRYYPWLLQKLYTYKQQTGVQLVDILSVHGYTDMDFSNTGGDDTLAAQQIRNRHTRILWDPNYKTPFWWKDIGINGGVINWIPTLRGWVDTYYPGLKIAFTEYSWGDEANLNGATTQADVLGIYGREGLDMANRWGTASGTVTFLASQIYRNYDGHNSTFGDTSVSATIANPDNLSAFAAVRGTDGALTVMVINKQQGSTPVTVNLAGFTAKAAAQAWQINSAAQTSITPLADVTVNSSTLTTTVPSQSITLFVIAAAPVTVAPAITTQPASQTTTTGNSVTFTASASGSPTPSFQWSKGSTAIAGATAASYAISSASLSDAGDYFVVATNSAGTATSNPAVLTVYAVPAITTQPASQSITTGSAVTFTAAASGTPAPTYQWAKNGVELSGATGSLYTIASTVPGDGGNYTVVATNPGGAATSNAAILDVGTPPAGFDVAAYLARYPAVAAIYGANSYGAWIYYRDHGIYNGEVYDDLFRVDEYLTLYPGLFALFGNDLGGALVHWLTIGRLEGRLGRIPLEFSATGYFSRNPDVAAAVNNDALLAWSHYWLYGIYEGRAYDEELRVFDYLAINADLTAAFVNDWRQAALHWMRYGRTEGRLGRLPLIFNVTEYLNRSPDVAATWGTNPTTVFLHYWTYGIDEGRTFDDLFRPDDYLALNPDLAAIFGTDRRGAFKHWVRYGQTEGRTARNP